MKRRKMMMAAMMAGMALTVTACGGSKKITEEDLATMSADEFEKAFSDAAEEYDASVAAEREQEEKEAAEASGELEHYEALPEMVSAEFEDGKIQLLDMVFQMPGTVADLVEAVENSKEDLTLMTGKREPESPYNPQLMVPDKLCLYIMNNGTPLAYAFVHDFAGSNEAMLLEDCYYLDLNIEDEYLEYAYLAGGIRCDGEGLTYNDIQERYSDRELKASSSNPSNLYFSLPTYNVTELDGFFAMFKPTAGVNFSTDPTTFQATRISQSITSSQSWVGIHRSDPTDEILSSSLGYGSIQFGDVVIDLGMTTGELYDLVENSEENIVLNEDLEEEVSPHDIGFLSIEKYGKRIAELRCYNPADAPAAMRDCPVVSISLGEYYKKYGYLPTGILADDIETAEDCRGIFANDTANTWTESQDRHFGGGNYITFTANEPVLKTFGTAAETPCTIYLEADLDDDDQITLEDLEYGILIPE